MTTLPLTEHKRNVGIAWFNGKTIQHRANSEDTWDDWYLKEPPAFNLPDDCYRIKPTPTRRFWRPEEIPVGAMVRRKDSPKWIGMITGINEHGEAYTSTVNNITDLNFTVYEVAPPGPANAVTWIPAGVEE